MNERVRAIFHTALKLSPNEREKLAKVLLDTLGTDPAEAEGMYAIDASTDPAGDDVLAHPPSDILQLYLDV